MVACSSDIAETRRSSFAIPRILLAPLAPLYRFGLETHRGLYRLRLKRRFRPDVPVICVGNLSTGGTGKTPVVIAIVRMLQAAGRRVGVLTRGYKGGARRLALRAERGAAELTVTPREVGDEPFLLAEKLQGAHLLVGADRAQSARLAVEEFGCNVLVLDDGFQHWGLARDLDIVLLDATMPAGQRHLLPWGAMREPWSALGRASVAVVTKAFDPAQRQRTAERVRREHPGLPLWQATFAPGPIQRLATGKAIDARELDAGPVVLVCGLAAPDSFERTARELGATIAARFFYPDHFAYPELVVRYVERQAARLGARWLLTTEKDAVKLRGRTSPQSPWAIVSIETQWLDPSEDDVRAFLERTIAAFRDEKE